MSEQVYGTQGGGGQEPGSSPASPQPVSPQPGSQPEGAELQGNEPITKADLDRMKQEAIEEATKRAQSMTDKMGSRLDTKIEAAINDANNAIALIESAGQPLTEQQKQAIRNKKINDAYNDPGQSSSQPSGQQAQAAPQTQEPGNQPKGNPIVQQEVQRIMRETGVYISSDEANQLIGPIGPNMSPVQWVNSFEQLARTRANNFNQPSGSNPVIPSAAFGGSAQPTQTVLRQQYDKEVAQIAEGTHPTIKRGQQLAFQQMQSKYRQKGLDI
jgi:hypothetical protein